MKRIFSSHNLQLAHHAKNLLASEGIRVVVRNEMLSSAMGELPPAECQAELWVNEADLRRAEEILFRQAAGGPDWTCAGCGEASGPQFTHCWRCGTLKGGEA